jgi:hypothetical protein
MGYGTERDEIDIQTLLQDLGEILPHPCLLILSSSLGYWDDDLPLEPPHHFLRGRDDDLDVELPPKFRDSPERRRVTQPPTSPSTPVRANKHQLSVSRALFVCPSSPHRSLREKAPWQIFTTWSTCRSLLPESPPGH